MITFRMQMTSEDASSNESFDECVLFIDDSNIFIEAQKYYATTYLKLRVRQDPRCRLDIGKLVELALGGRTGCHVKLYGTYPPALDTVWKKIREKGLEVELCQKDFKGKEKEVDTAMTADATAYALKSQAYKQTVIIIAGDRDYCPLVRKLLDEKTEWNVEVLAFRSSISNQMSKIKSDRFEIKTFDKLIEQQTDSCCYVQARWLIEKRRMPRSRTIILRFTESLISPEADNSVKKRVDQMLKQYAEEITVITEVPCSYHLCNQGENAGRWVYITGHTWVKPEPGDRGIDFFRICIENRYKLNEKCSEICHLYETYKTAMEIDDSITNNELQLQNRFEGLDIEDEDLSQIFDDDDSGMKATENLSQGKTESEGEDSDTKEFTEVKSSSEARQRGPKYSASCVYEFSCSNGSHCDYKHTQEQVNFFKANGGKGRKGYKSKPCQDFHKKRSCKHGPGVAPNCAYYHSPKEARCYVCKNSNLALKYIGHASHDETCPLRISTN